MENNGNPKTTGSDDSNAPMRYVHQNHGGLTNSIPDDEPPKTDEEYDEMFRSWDRLFANDSRITVWEHIGKPVIAHRDDLTADEMNAEIDRIFALMAKKELFLDICQPIDLKEFYDFVMTEFMQTETNDMHAPGMNTRFIYEEFFPEKYPFDDSAYRHNDESDDPLSELIKNPSVN